MLIIKKMNTLRTKIINTLNVKDNIDPKKEIKKRINFLKKCLKITNSNLLIIGISGGQDSALAGRLCQIAVEEMNWSHEQEYKLKYSKNTKNNFNKNRFSNICIQLPYIKQIDKKDVKIALSFIKPSIILKYNIGLSVDQINNELKKNNNNTISISDHTKGNIKSRVRMVFQYALANEMNGLVVGTSHASEAVMGFFTKFGDSAADVFPLYGLTKRQGKRLLKTLDAPSSICKKIPTADLLDKYPGQSDEESLGITYNEIDSYLENKKYICKKSLNLIEKQYIKTQHKRKFLLIP